MRCDDLVASIEQRDRNVDTNVGGQAMKTRHAVAAFTAVAVAALAGALHVRAQQQNAMGFFVTSVGVGDGAKLGGLEGADKHCQTLAAAVGSSKTWHAYLSTQAEGGKPAVNARDRIGSGPWFNQKGQKIADNVAQLYGDTLEQARLGNNLSRTTVFTEKGDTIKGAGDTPNTHDILTGSQPDGTAYPPGADHTCKNWTSNAGDSAQLGHFDRTGGGNTSWNSAHPSKGCSQPNLVATGGAGLLYCFATN